MELEGTVRQESPPSFAETFLGLVENFQSQPFSFSWKIGPLIKRNVCKMPLLSMADVRVFHQKTEHGNGHDFDSEMLL